VQRAATAPITVPPGGAATSPPIRYPSVQGRALWREAREAVDEQFDALRTHLLATDDPGLHTVAAQGYPALTKRLGTQMLVAMAELDTVPPERAAAARAQALKAISEYRQFLASDGLVRVLEKNPFGVAVSIQATLGGALDQIERALDR
jgi:stage V sporulation protein SpoVS